ncbi:hypothetical protein WA171_005273 [Blastocystis sp. BT1]
MTMTSGSDAQTCLHTLFRNCVNVAPSVLLIDPLQEIAAENPNRRINRSDVDQALLAELRHILEEAKTSGVTVIGVTTQESTCLSRVIHAFDEKIEFFSPSQQDRVTYFKHLINHYIDMNSTTMDASRYAEYLSLHSPSFSWSDINHCLRTALKVCSHSMSHSCPLCFLQIIQRHQSDSSIIQNLPATTPSLIPSMESLDQSLRGFSQIGGNYQLKEYLMEYIVNPCLQWQQYQHFGVSPPTGILLYGPPGTGKTAISRACSQLGHLNFICPSISELICKEIGESERRIRDLFSRAIRCSPCILFFDEIESVFKNRRKEESESGVSQQILTQLLLQIDNLHNRKSQDFVFVIGATNLPEQLDPSLLRPGRLDKHILVPLPSLDERKEIIEIFASDTLVFSDDYSLDDLALQTEGYTGADLKFLIRSIILLSIDVNCVESEKKSILVKRKTVDKALLKVKPSTNKEEYQRILKWKVEDNY